MVTFAIAARGVEEKARARVGFAEMRVRVENIVTVRGGATFADGGGEVGWKEAVGWLGE